MQDRAGVSLASHDRVDRENAREGLGERERDGKHAGGGSEGCG